MSAFGHGTATRQGERALTLRDADEQRTQNATGITELAARSSPPQASFTLVIEIDAWNIRERDHWGKTKAFVKAGKELGRWHWVYTGTVFRLDQRGTTESGRPVIAERGYVATRRGLDSFEHQLYAETLQRGLQEAQTILILADGAVWIWNLAEDRFPGAVQRVDLHHVQEHLWNLAHVKGSTPNLQDIPPEVTCAHPGSENCLCPHPPLRTHYLSPPLLPRKASEVSCARYSFTFLLCLEKISNCNFGGEGGGQRVDRRWESG